MLLPIGTEEDVLVRKAPLGASTMQIRVDPIPSKAVTCDKPRLLRGREPERVENCFREIRVIHPPSDSLLGSYLRREEDTIP